MRHARPVLMVAKPRSFLFFLLALLLLSGEGAMISRVLAAEDQLDAVKKAFEVFQDDWIQKVQAEGNWGEDKNTVEADPQGGYRASYRKVSEAREMEVKPTDDKKSPYVGVLRYEEQLYSSHGETPELAKQGPFECVKRVVVTEIFRYSEGKWVY